METELTTVPTFTYRQGSHTDDSFDEIPITVEYYKGTITLRQEGFYELDETINISPKHLDKLFRAIKKNLPAAKEWLERNSK